MICIQKIRLVKWANDAFIKYTFKSYEYPGPLAFLATKARGVRTRAMPAQSNSTARAVFEKLINMQLHFDVA